MMTRTWFVSVSLIALISASTWKFFSSPVSPQETSTIPLSIEKGESVDTIAKKLKDKGLIRSTAAFKVWVMLRNIARTIQAGEYLLTPAMSLDELTLVLTHGTDDALVTLIEGWRREEIAEELERKLLDAGGNFAKSEFLTSTEGQEGYLFPDTYRLSKSMTAQEIARLLRDTFDQKVDEKLKLQIRNQGLSLEEGITIASIVEREARAHDDRPIVAGILIKRLKAGWPLQADATVQYALGFLEKDETWWKRSLTKDDLLVDSPYNTYSHVGLPPAPICNPSLASILAVAHQEPTHYWFYLSDHQGQLHFARTIEEHKQNIAKYLGK